ncbi:MULTISPECIES: ricin-type beta-trefoil lectin domain protein [Streptomyces]|uniref:Ricin B lectin domain-containing protein n=1 Tax=Streptomyces luteosporeus TaxID=173856 RepID=A0ABN3U018_9ACTN
MTRSRKLALVLAAAGTLTGMAAVPASAGAAVKAPIATSIQVYSDDTNLDEYAGYDVLTRDARHSWQVFQLTQLDDGSYTIRGTHFGKCLAATGRGQRITQSPCNSGNLAQRWLLDTRADNTPIESRKFRGEVLQAHGLDQAVTIEARGTGRAAQTWGLYLK